MKKVWAEHKEKLVSDTELKMMEDLTQVAEREGLMRLDREFGEHREDNCNLNRDKVAIWEINKKLGVDDVTFNNKVILHQIDMHLKAGVELEGCGQSLIVGPGSISATSKTTR